MLNCLTSARDLRPALAGVALVFLAGCNPQIAPLGEWRGPSSLASMDRSPWSFQGEKGEVLISRNYRVFSTVANPKVRERVVQLLEAARSEYARIIVTPAPPDRPLEAYLFANRSQWAEFTIRQTGSSASLYLQIQRGGYSLGDYFVGYYNNGADVDLWSLVAHEGFHQYCARQMKGRLPAFLEEGLACSFEQVRWNESSGTPQFNPQVNPPRAHSLRVALDAHAEWPLEQLIRLDAGAVLAQSGNRIEAFYAQSWAFARFAQEFGNGKYKAKFAKWVEGTVTGDMFDPTGTHRRIQDRWDRSAVRPIMEHYFETDLDTLSKEFDEWCHYLAHEEFDRQWVSR